MEFFNLLSQGQAVRFSVVQPGQCTCYKERERERERGRGLVAGERKKKRCTKQGRVGKEERKSDGQGP